MKIRIKATGEIVDFSQFSINSASDYEKFEFIEDETPVKDIDWEQRRFELIKAALQGCCASHDWEGDAETVIAIADAIIEKLK